MKHSYTKQPVTIQAFKYSASTFNKEDVPDFIREALDNGTIVFNKAVGFDKTLVSLIINTLEGPLYASTGDMIIKGIHGELYPCKPDIFEASYTKAIEVPDHLPAHMQRVFEEKFHLDVKLKALDSYLRNGAPNAKLIEKHLLREQQQVMIKYSDILTLRLSLYDQA